MKKNIIIPITIIFWLIIILPIVVYGYIKFELNSLKNDTYSYLLKKYNKNEIQKVETQLTIASYHYSAFVTFKDEPELMYEYFRVDGKIRQGSPFPYDKEGSKYKYLELNKD